MLLLSTTTTGAVSFSPGKFTREETVEMAGLLVNEFGVVDRVLSCRSEPGEAMMKWKDSHSSRSTHTQRGVKQ